VSYSRIFGLPNRAAYIHRVAQKTLLSIHFQKFQFHGVWNLTVVAAPEIELSPGAFWGAIGMRAAGVAIVTTEGSDGPAGFLALSATHLTASPPTMTVAIDGRTSALAAVRESGAFAINFLASDAVEIYQRFTAKDGPKGAGRFDGLDYTRLTTGAPVFSQVTGALDCRLEEAIERYGTVLAIGRIVNLVFDKEASPMIHFQGKPIA
jgi:flavin reductase (DIM6/NTAB) family NADH-FMN oxidoreductase RutF